VALEALQFRAGEAIPALPGHEDRGLAVWVLGEAVTGFRGVLAVAHILPLGLTGSVFSPAGWELHLTGQVRASLTKPLGLQGRVVERGTIAYPLDGRVRARLAAALALDGRVLLRGTKPLGLAGELSLFAQMYLPLDLTGRVRSVRFRLLGLVSGYVFGHQAKPVALSGATRARIGRPLGVSGRVIVVAQTRLQGRVLAHQGRGLRLTGEVKVYALPPGAPASATRTRLPWSAQERLRSLT
jgi:hypothetical protein